MVKITASLVKKLRERTGAGIMDCKRALIESNGSIILAIENMRKFGGIKAEKKATATTNSGVVTAKTKGDYGVILEVNCQTDFGTKNSEFQLFIEKILYTALNEKISEVDVLKEKFEEERVALVSRMSENINIRRAAILRGDVVGSYVHSMRIGVLVAATGTDEELLKHIAMHIAASNPEFVTPEDVPTKIFEKEYQIQLDIAMQSNKSQKIAQKITEGRMLKFINGISLINQDFIIDQKKTVGQILKENNASITNFIRFELGEVIQKK